MTRPRATFGRANDHDPTRAVVDDLRSRADTMDVEFSFFSGRMHPFQLHVCTVVHSLARAGAADDARRLLSCVKSSSRRGSLSALALAQAERGEADAARQTALEIPAVGKPSAQCTLVEIANILARRGDFAEAVRTAKELADAEKSARTLAHLAQLQAEVEVGNFANVRTVPESDSDYSWVGMAKLYSAAGSRGGVATTAWANTLRQAIERARAITKASNRSETLDTLVHNLAWAGDVEGAVLAARAN
jgi:hypothetical protein